MSSKTDQRASRTTTTHQPPQPEQTAKPAWHGTMVFEMWETQSNFLLGRVLTVIDSSFPDPVQRKAAKDLVRQQFHAQTKHVYSIAVGEGHMVQAAGELPKP